MQFYESPCQVTVLLYGNNTMTSLHSRFSMNRSELEKISKALADKTPINCGEIVSRSGLTAATVSHHLKVLSEANLIICRREGQFVYSEAIPKTITAYTRALAKISRGVKATRRR